MREIDASEITDTVARLCIDACHELPADVIQAFHEAERKEVSPFGKCRRTHRPRETCSETKWGRRRNILNRWRKPATSYPLSTCQRSTAGPFNGDGAHHRHI